MHWQYVRREFRPELLAAAERETEYANVTTPYKLDAARILGSALRSVNTIVRGRGFSTDAAILEQVTGCYKPAIVGGGGAATAFRQALPEARVFSRRGEWPPDVRDADLVVHATPVRDEVLFELSAGQTLVDLPYPRTATAEAAATAGACVVDGLEVLAAQGAASFELWTGAPAPVAVMRRALGLPSESRARIRRGVARSRARGHPLGAARRARPRQGGDRRRSAPPPAGVRPLPPAADRDGRGRGARRAAARAHARDAARARRPESRPQELDVGDESLAARGRAAGKGDEGGDAPPAGSRRPRRCTEIRPRRRARRARACVCPPHRRARRRGRGREGAARAHRGRGARLDRGRRGRNRCRAQGP